MKRIMSWFLLLSFIGLLLFVVSKPVKAQEKTFPVGVSIPVSNIILCFNKEDAQIIADNKSERSPAIDALVNTRKCVPVFGFYLVGVYTKEVYRNGEWSVWEFKSGSAVMYEATNWVSYIPKKKGELES